MVVRTFSRYRSRWITALGVTAAVAIAVVIALPMRPDQGPGMSAAATPASTTTSLATSRPSPTPIAVEPSETGDAIAVGSDRVVLRVQAASDVGGETLGVFIYDDGSWLDARGLTPTVRPLSQAGLEQVLAKVRDSRLFTETHSIPAPPVDHGFTSFQITFVDGDRTVEVSATNAARDAESKALVALAEALLAPEGWIGPDGWRDGSSRERPYLAATARLTSEVRRLPRDAWTNPARSTDRLGWPLESSPLAVGEPVEIEGRDVRCSLISGVEEFAVRGALSTVSQSQQGSRDLVTEWFLWTPDRSLLKLSMRPYLPHESAGCIPGEMPSPPTLAAAPRPDLGDVLRIGRQGWTPAGEPHLVVMIMSVNEEAPDVQVSYYADGSVVWHDPPPPLLGYGVRRLSVSGQAAIEQLLESSGLAQQDWHEEVPEDARYDRAFSILSGDSSPDGDHVAVTATDRGVHVRADRIVRLAEKLANPVAWLPPGSWIVEPSVLLPYRPPGLTFMIETHVLIPDDPELANLVPYRAVRWPLGGTLPTYGSLAPEYEPTVVRTASLSPDVALAVLDALAAAGIEGSGHFFVGAETPETYFEITLTLNVGDWGP